MAPTPIDGSLWCSADAGGVGSPAHALNVLTAIATISSINIRKNAEWAMV
ncbi:hypothetical protein [Pollutimonas bauzanensis]